MTKKLKNRDGQINYITKLHKASQTDWLYVVILASISIVVPFVWLHGRVIYFWDGALPFQSLSDLHYLNSSWNQLNGLGYPVPIDKFSILVTPYIIFSFLGASLWITQFLLLSLFLMVSSVGMFYLIRHLNYLLDKKVKPVFLFLPSLLYIANYYSMTMFGNFYPGLYAYALLPVSTLLLMISIENMRKGRIMIVYITLFVITIEIASGTFISLTPLMIYFLFALIGMVVVFQKRIVKRIGNGPKKAICRYFLVLTLIVVTTNLWWMANFLITISIQYAASGPGFMTTIYIDFTTFGDYPGKWLSTIALYPQLFPILYWNYFPWINLYSLNNVIFPAIGILFFAILVYPLLFLKQQKTIFDSRIKAGVYIMFFSVLFFALQGINPINKLLYLFLQLNDPYLLPYLYGTRLPFTRLDLTFFSSILFYISIYELYSRSQNKSQSKHIRTQTNLANLDKKQRLSPTKVTLVLILVLILFVYPWYFYTPASMQVYSPGQGEISETVTFPNYFYNLSNYISIHSNGSNTMILPLTTDMVSMNFSQGNSFVDDSYAGYLFGSPVITGSENYSLYTYINSELQMPDSNFSALLNNLNVKYVILNTIFYPHVLGYPSSINISHIKRYLNSQLGLQEIGTYGSIFLYQNIHYRGIIQTGSIVPENGSLYNDKNFLSLNQYFSSINTTINAPFSEYNNMSFRYNGSLSIEFPKSTHKLQKYGYYISNKINFTANISNYHYLIIDAQGSNGNFFNGTYFAVNAQTYLLNGTAGSYYIKPEHSPTFYQGNSTPTQYVYPLFGSTFGFSAASTGVGYYNGSDGDGLLLHRVVIAIDWHSNSTFPAYLNISKIGLAKSINPDTQVYSGRNISVANFTLSNYPSENSLISNANVSYREISPAKYKVIVTNSSGYFPLFLKQNFNSKWVIEGLPRSTYHHFVADNYGNCWVIYGTGNFSFSIVFSEQKIYNEINLESVLANSTIFVATAAIITYSLIKRDR